MASNSYRLAMSPAAQAQRHRTLVRYAPGPQGLHQRALVKQYPGYRGFSGMGDVEDEDLSMSTGVGGCGCHAGLAGGVEGILRQHPFLVLAGAFLLGYSLKGGGKGLF